MYHTCVFRSDIDNFLSIKLAIKLKRFYIRVMHGRYTFPSKLRNKSPRVLSEGRKNIAVLHYACASFSDWHYMEKNANPKDSVD